MTMFGDPRLYEADRKIEALTRENAALKAERDALREALSELHALVKGECPSLLNEDSGGDAALDIAIEELLARRALASPASEMRHLTEAEQRTFAKALRRSVTILPDLPAPDGEREA